MRVDNNAYARVCEERDELAALCASYREVLNHISEEFPQPCCHNLNHGDQDLAKHYGDLAKKSLSLPAPKALERVRVLEEIMEAGRHYIGCFAMSNWDDVDDDFAVLSRNLRDKIKKLDARERGE